MTMDMADNRELLTAIGEALYGPSWQTELAAAVNVSDRTMRRWIAEQYTLPAGVWRDLAAALDARQSDLIGLRQQALKQAARAR